MTPTDLKSARHQLGLSVRLLALALAPTRPPSLRTVRRWEAGDNPIPGWVPPRLAALLAEPQGAWRAALPPDRRHRDVP